MRQLQLHARSLQQALSDVQEDERCGGEQVAWQLDTGKRTYLPRLAGALTAIAPVARDPARYVLTQADNTLRLVCLAGLCVLYLLPSTVAGWLPCYAGRLKALMCFLCAVSLFGLTSRG